MVDEIEAVVIGKKKWFEDDLALLFNAETVHQVSERRIGRERTCRNCDGRPVLESQFSRRRFRENRRVERLKEKRSQRGRSIDGRDSIVRELRDQPRSFEPPVSIGVLADWNELGDRRRAAS